MRSHGRCKAVSNSAVRSRNDQREERHELFNTRFSSRRRQQMQNIYQVECNFSQVFELSRELDGEGGVIP